MVKVLDRLEMQPPPYGPFESVTCLCNAFYDVKKPHPRFSVLGLLRDPVLTGSRFLRLKNRRFSVLEAQEPAVLGSPRASRIGEGGLMVLGSWYRTYAVCAVSE